MSTKRSRTSAKDILDRVSGGVREEVQEESQPAKRMAKPAKPRRVKKTWTLDVDTLLAIQKIQANSLRTQGKTISESKIVDEAVLRLLSEKGLSLD
jgi:hypothetical protein